MAETTIDSAICLGCHARIAGDALVCPYCATLVHRERLSNFAEMASNAELAGRIDEAVSRYEQMLALLPAEIAQAKALRHKLAGLRTHPRVQMESGGGSISTFGNASPALDLAGWMKKGLGAAVAAIVLGWKFKFALLGLAGKGKLLLLGLTKFSTVASMFAFLGVYWSLYRFSFALGLVLLIYVHEMGHVWAARKIGVPVTAPMFIPGFGAFIGLKSRLANPVEEAYVGLAGPIWGVAGSLVCVALWAVLQAPVLLVIGTFAALINLFNLIPVWQLDGAHAFRAFSTRQRWIVMLFPLVVAMAAWDGMLLLVSAGAAYQLFSRRNAPAVGHNPSVLQFCALVLVVAIVLRIGSPVLHPAAEAAEHSKAGASQTAIQPTPAGR